jgi:hypothetical protein
LLFQPGHDLIDPARCAAGDVLDNDPLGAQLCEDPGILIPEARAASRKASALARAGDVLARKTAANEIDRFEIGRSN